MSAQDRSHTIFVKLLHIKDIMPRSKMTTQ